MKSKENEPEKKPGQMKQTEDRGEMRQEWGERGKRGAPGKHSRGGTVGSGGSS